MKRVENRSILSPDYIARSVLDIEPNTLKKAGIKFLVFDIDETLVPNRKNKLTEEYADFLRSLEEVGFHIIIGSNSRRDFSNITKHLKGASVVKPSKLAFKPLRGYYSKVISTTKVDPTQIAMIGDRIINDIIGGNISGLTTILVEPYVQKRGKIHKNYVRRMYQSAT